MNNYTIDEWLEKEPYLKKLSDSVLFLDKEIIDEYTLDDSKVKGTSTKLLKNLISNSDYYKYVCKLFNDEIEQFQCSYIVLGDVSGNIRLNKREIVERLEVAISNNYLELNDEEMKRFNDLKEHISLKALNNKYFNTLHDYNVDNINFTISFLDIIEFLMEYDSINDYDEYYKEIKLEYFAYGVIDFLKKNKIIDNYLLPDAITNKYQELELGDKIDIEALNQFTETTTSIINDVVIDQELKSEILVNMPDDLSLLEKAIYIYIKMCKLLRYDGEFYAVNQKGEVTKKHEDINHIKNVTLENNEIVCYEFNAIYAKLLSELNINFEINSSFVSDTYGGAHANLLFRVEKFLIEADSVTSILQGDLIRAKLNYPLEGLKCKNINLKTRKEFSNLISKIYKLIAMGDNVEKVEEHETFNDILREYKNVTENEIYLDIDEKLDLLMTKINDSKLIGLDVLSYMLLLRKIIFNSEERKYNIEIAIIRNNEFAPVDKVAMPSAIITINQIDINDVVNNTYYLYNPREPLQYITLNNLRKRFNGGSFEFVDESDKEDRIPGIYSGKGTK